MYDKVSDEEFWILNLMILQPPHSCAVFKLLMYCLLQHMNHWYEHSGIQASSVIHVIKISEVISIHLNSSL